MKIRYITIVFILFAFVVNSCDKVSPPYVESKDYCSGNKKVLLEDYTGHGCVNCPSAAVLAHELKNQFCDRVVIISVHAGYFAKPYFENDSLFAADFTTEAGDAWDTFFGNSIAGNPNGLVDRVKKTNGYVIPPSAWGETIDPLLSEPALALITISSDFNKDTKILSTTINTNFETVVSGKYKLIVCITQDNVISVQKNNNEEIGPTPIDMNYVNNHMLRKSINGTWGEFLSPTGTVDVNSTYKKTYTQQFVDEWIPKDCNIVAFVYNDETKQVIQVEEHPVLE